ncbi:AfsR/SARP family transcriptional regulator [Paractinoplanes atraurantiacus]|uniref:DNA-binding transcriptional activator of the SARP family n=1 Tax=Paractinoplanes atraurantiacus TaxID=1036182 RepID=A0A285KPT9_9ACTN|nr:AfsR/SARP family transcriptional regulator [Actinoplanes atraurantiacus]SNY73416.1 DNA-binding transcriptional activator of the SARP family [Actinoplanes atraurantiacus]
MRFSVLGPLRVTDHDREVPLGGPRHRALLCALLVHPRQVVPADRLIDILWGPSPPRSAAEMLHVRVSEVRRFLRTDEPAPLLARRSAGYVLQAAPGNVDAEVFEELAAAGRRALAAGEAAEAIDLLERALGLWRGEALPEVAGRDFAAARIATLSELRARAAEDAVDADLLAGRHHDVCARLPAVIAAQPLRERPRRQLMLALYRSGRQSEALAEYDRIGALLSAELGLDPGPELRDLRVRILRHDPTLSAEPAPRRRRDNLPSPLTSFVGRAADRATLSHHLSSARLVSIVGAGGAGKSRLATEVARDLRGDFPGGVWLVELSPLLDPRLIVPTTAQVLGIPEHPERDRLDQIVAALRNERL